MPRIRIRTKSLVVALAALALTAGFAAAHAMPAASNDGLQKAQSVSGKVLPVGADAANDQSDETNSEDAGSAPTDTHGATVSAAAQGDTPDGFDNHGAYVSSIANANGVAHRNPAATGDNPPAAADAGLAHKP